MGYPTKIQLIKRKRSEQFYVNFPAALAQALELSKGEQVEWIVHDKAHMIMARREAPPHPARPQKKTSRPDSPRS
jgi:antitoxin component of MazEF toxin-antitoxin module